MPRGSSLRQEVRGKDRRPVFNLDLVFPEVPGVKRGPFPKQNQVYKAIKTGSCEGGGYVYQGGKGCAKTICGAAGDIMVHHLWPGTRSAVCRESYPALMTSTWDEYEQMLNRMPEGIVKSVRRPSVNSMGTIEWAIGGITVFLSLSDSKTWASMNLGFAWVDEGHLQQGEIVDKLADRLRQQDAPRTMLITTNPMGRFWAWKWSAKESEERRPNWHFVKSSMFENPALPEDYIRRMEAKYPPGTPAHRRWVLGESAALEGTVFENFYPDPEDCIHVIPEIELPDHWDRGRGLDWGIDNPCVVVWGARSPRGDWYVYRTHEASNRPVNWHAERILELEGEEHIRWVPSDPEIFRRTQWEEGSVSPVSVAMKFRASGVRVTPANNQRKTGLEALMDLIAVDDTEIHPITLKPGRPRLFLLDTDDNRNTIQCLATLQWRPAPTTGSTDSPDDVAKKDDHHYDALRYLVAEVADRPDRAPYPGRPPRTKGTHGYRGA